MPVNYHLVTGYVDQSMMMQGTITDHQSDKVNLEFFEYDGTHSAFITGFPILNRHNFSGHGSSTVESASDALKGFALYLLEIAESLGLPQED